MYAHVYKMGWDASLGAEPFSLSRRGERTFPIPQPFPGRGFLAAKRKSHLNSESGLSGNDCR